MLTDMIVEEDFEKDEESWYGRQDLEHGKDSWERSRPSACYIVITVWTYIYIQRLNYGAFISVSQYKCRQYVLLMAGPLQLWSKVISCTVLYCKHRALFFEKEK